MAGRNALATTTHSKTNVMGGRKALAATHNSPKQQLKSFYLFSETYYPETLQNVRSSHDQTGSA